MHQAEQADDLYYVESGRFRVVVNQKELVANVSSGEIIGELAFFAGGVRTADVIAERDSIVLGISRQDFEAISKEHPELNSTLLALIASRLATTTALGRSISERPARIIALMGAGSSKLPEGLVAALAEALTTIVGQGTHVKTKCYDQSMAEHGGGYHKWLSDEEAKGSYILVDTSGPKRWSERVCRNADSLLLVADNTTTDRQINPFEESAFRWISPHHRSLLIIRGKQNQAISGSRSWIDPREIRLHHHLALDSQADFSRLSRFLTGNAIGIVLAGGGALGCAHLGVIKALQKANIPLDFIGGTSAGAAMGCAIASGLSVEEVLGQMEDMFVKAGAMRKITLPIHSLLDPTVFDQQLKLRYGYDDITDQATNFFATSTNLSTNTLHTHRSGPRWEAIRASGSLPTILPPFIDDQKNILVDGGVLNNSPVSVMHELKSGPNIVVNLSDYSSEWRLNVSYADVRSRFELCRDLLLRRNRQHQFPSIIELMSRSMVISSRIASTYELTDDDQVLSPPLISNMQLYDWTKGRELASLAEKYTQEQIAQGNILKQIWPQSN